jgi:hypothetical protein
MELKTNRDLYKQIATLIKREADNPVTLEQYLCTVLVNSAKLRHQEKFSLAEFFEILEAGFSPVNNATINEESPDGVVSAYVEWQTTICRQIKDLREMGKKGLLKNDQKYFGMSAPGGGYWYNFDPSSFLECAMAGSFGGWEEGDDTGRQFVPGEVVAYNEQGEMITCDPRDLQEPVTDISEITWKEFEDFLWSGQSYE